MPQLRYYPEHDPDDNATFPFYVCDRLGAEPEHQAREEIMGACWSARDAAIVAWALSHAQELVAQHADLRALIDACVETPLDYRGEVRPLKGEGE